MLRSQVSFSSGSMDYLHLFTFKTVMTLLCVTFKFDALCIMNVALVELMEDLVLIVDNAAEGAGLVIATGQEAGQVLQAVSVGET